MCTLSWVPRADGYTVFFNRDEQRSRALGLPPGERVLDGTRLVAPRDPQGGGSWIAANEHGVTLALLNGYGPSRDVPDRVSRGRLVIMLADAAARADVTRRLRALPLARFAPFTLAAFAPGEPVAFGIWDGAVLTIGNRSRPGLLATSSSLDQRRAELERHGAFDAALEGRAPDERLLDQLHRGHRGQREVAVCMHRPDAATVSLTRVAVGPALVAMGHEAGAPCRRGPALVVTIPRSQAAVARAS
jgi:hypothetical protein